MVGVAGTDLLYKSAQGCEELPTSNDLPFSNYENCDMVRLDSNRTETIFGYTKKNVVGG